MIPAIRDATTSALVRTLFADALAALADRLTPDQAASFETALVETLVADLTDAKDLHLRGLLGQALVVACGRPGGTGAARVAEALTAAIRDPKTRLPTLKPLAAALAEASGRLPPKATASYSNQAVDALDALWVVRTAALDRAFLAEALAELWRRLDPTNAAQRAQRTAADLEGAIRDSKTTPNELCRLAIALAAVSNYLSPTERNTQANVVADTLLTALRRQPNSLEMKLHVGEAPATLFAHLDRSGTLRTADAILAVLDDPNVQANLPVPLAGVHQDRFSLYETMFNKVTARLDECDLQRLLGHHLAAGRLQRTLLDVLADSKNRSFRNTWDYLDSIESSPVSK
jgi:hypothetical protein